MTHIDLQNAIYDPKGNPLTYPGEMPDSPVFVIDNKAMTVNASDHYQSFHLEDGRDVDSILLSRGLAPIAERIAQVAFGANRNIENLVWKFKHYLAKNRSINQELLILPATIPNAEVVACNIGYWGYVYAGLLTTTSDFNLRKYLMGTQCPVTLLLLDEEQMKALHHSEGVMLPGDEQPGVSCKVSDVIADLSPNLSCSAQVYSLAVPFLSFDGHQPVAFEMVKTQNRGNYETFDQIELFQRINDVTDAEKPHLGRLPIAQSLREKALKLLQQDVLATRRMMQDDFYTSIRESLSENFKLRDSDGVIRMGLEDVYSVRDIAKAWHFNPVFNPQLNHSRE
ncbi:MAG: hypothetical protein ACI845_001665 [Gammaproteobacteria bacterium]